MNLGFHYHIPAYIKEGKIFTMAFQGLFIDSLAQHCNSLTLIMYSPTSKEMKELDYSIRSENVRLISIMKHYKIPVRIALYPFIRSKFLNACKDLDVLLVRAPTPLLPQMIRDLKDKTPYSFLVVGEMSLHVDSIKQAEWRKSLIRFYVNWNEKWQEKYAGNALVFANSKVTFNKYKELSKKCVEVRTTTLKKEDFYFREDTCKGNTIEILFTGRIEDDKGILEITEAVGRLNKNGISCRLNIVGWIVPKDPIEEHIIKIARQYNIEDKVIFHGFKTAGAELFAYYKNADLFVVASRNNEGFPRTIWESLAHSLPVLCTAVGSIPSFLSDKKDALFIERNNPEDIYSKIKTLISDENLRKSLISHGRETVKEVTLEIQSEKMINALNEFVRP
ncbi:MAG: glycosyltransferase family 4 protein [Flavobacteriales bacterium]|nr:glycosyltransferase family 4 protein [Flavobacteriales bacterium]